MKKILLVFAIFALAPSAQAEISTSEAPIQKVAIPVGVEVSSNAWSNVTSTTTRFRHMNIILLDNPQGNSFSMVGHIGDCDSTAVAVSVLGPIEIAPGANGGFITIAEDHCLWMQSLSTAGGETIYIQGVSQKR